MTSRSHVAAVGFEARQGGPRPDSAHSPRCSSRPCAQLGTHHPVHGLAAQSSGRVEKEPTSAQGGAGRLCGRDAHPGRRGVALGWEKNGHIPQTGTRRHRGGGARSLIPQETLTRARLPPGRTLPRGLRASTVAVARPAVSGCFGRGGTGGPRGGLGKACWRKGPRRGGRTSGIWCRWGGGKCVLPQMEPCAEQGIEDARVTGGSKQPLGARARRAQGSRA